MKRAKNHPVVKNLGNALCIDEILQSAKEAVHRTASFLSIGLECVGLADKCGEIDVL